MVASIVALLDPIGSAWPAEFSSTTSTTYLGNEKGDIMTALNSTWTKRVVGAALLAAAPLFVGMSALPQASAQVGISIERGHGHGGHGGGHGSGGASSGNHGGAHSPGHQSGKGGAARNHPGSHGGKGSLNGSGPHPILGSAQR